MSETALNTYATNGSNTSAGAPNTVAVVNDGTANRQIVVLGAGDGTGTIVDGTTSHPVTVTPTMGSSDFYPGYNAINKGGLPLQTDEYGNLNVRGAITTDEGTHRTSFTGSNVYWTLAGVTFTNGSSTVTIASGFSTNDIHFADYIRLGTDAESAWGQISFINSDTTITLAAPYTGTGGTGTAYISGVGTSTGSGATISVVSGAMTIAAGTTAAAQTYIYSYISAAANVFQTTLSLSQRIANQDIYIELASNVQTTIKSFSRFHFTGTTNTQVITETGWNPTTTPSASEIESNTITLPNSAVTSSNNIYRIDQTDEAIYFLINDVLVATHRTRTPHVYSMGSNAFLGDIRVLNGTTPATSTNIVIGGILSKTYDRIDVANVSQGSFANSQMAQIVDNNNNAANVIVPGTAQASPNALATAYTGTTVAFTTTTAQAVATTDVSQFSSISVQITSNGTTSTVTPQFSDDNTNWVGGTFTTSNGTGVSASGSAAATGLWSVAVNGHRYFRLNVTGITGLTTAGNLHLSTAPVAYQSGGYINTPVSTAASNSFTASSQTINGTAVSGYGYGIFTIKGTYSGLQFTYGVSDDSGTTIWNVPLWDLGNNTLIKPGTTVTPGTNASVSYMYQLMPNGSEIKLTSTAFTSGTATVRFSAGGQTPPAIASAFQAFSDGLTGSTAPTSASLIGGSDLSGNLQSAGIVAGDTGFNGIATASASRQYSFTTSASGAQTLLANTPVEGYTYIEVVFSSVGVGLALNGQFSTTSGGTYINNTGFSSSPNGAFVNALGTTANTIYATYVRGNYFQLAVSALTSGTFAGTVTLRAVPPPASTLNTSGQLSSAPITTATGTITTSSSSITSNSYSTYNGWVPVTISGTYAGVTFTIQVSTDNGTTYGAAAVWDVNNSVYKMPSSGNAPAITPTANATNTYLVQAPPNSSGTLVKVLASAYTSGTANVRIGGSAAPAPVVGVMSQLIDSAGNGRGANVNANNELTIIDQGLRPAATALNTYSVQITTKTTTTPTASTAYISSISISQSVAGTVETLTIQDKQGTPLVLVSAIALSALTAPVIYNYQTPVKMVSGIDVITGGTTAGTTNVFINYYQ